MRFGLGLLSLLVGCEGGISAVDTDPTGETGETDAPDETAETEETATVETDDSDVVETDLVSAETTIYDIQSGVVSVGVDVRVETVVVTAVDNWGLYVSHAAGGAQSGIWVYFGAGNGSTNYSRGQLVHVSGQVNEYGDGDNTVTELVYPAIEVIGTASDPAPVVVAADVFLNDPEPYEGCLVQVNSAAVGSVEDNGDWTLAGVPIGEQFYAVDAVYPGDQFASVVGVVEFAFNEHRLAPRDSSDLQGYSSDVVRAEDLLPGELVITELMINPNDADCSPESEGEYIEIFNPGLQPVDLRGLTIRDHADTSSEVEFMTLVGPGEYVLGVNSPLANFCYADSAVEADFDFYPDLNNTGDSVSLAFGQTVVDAVDFFAWQNLPAGASLSLKSGFVSSSANDSESAWCSAPGYIEAAAGDKGTPGAENDCP